MQRGGRRDDPPTFSPAGAKTPDTGATRRSSRRRGGGADKTDDEAPLPAGESSSSSSTSSSASKRLHGRGVPSTPGDPLLKIDERAALMETDAFVKSPDAKLPKMAPVASATTSMPEKRKLDTKNVGGRKKPCLKETPSREKIVEDVDAETDEMKVGNYSSPMDEGEEDENEDLTQEKLLSQVNLVQIPAASSIGSAPNSVPSSAGSACSTSLCSSPGDRPPASFPPATNLDSVSSSVANSSASPFSPLISAASCSHSQGTQTNEFHRKIPSRAHPPPGLQEWLEVFKGWSHAERLISLDQLVELCEPQQVKHVMTVIEPQFQRDFISLLPKELALYVLSYLEPRDLARAAQTCRYWRLLCEDNLLWKEKCLEAEILEPLRIFLPASAAPDRTRTVSECSGLSGDVFPARCLTFHEGPPEAGMRISPSPPLITDFPLYGRQRRPSSVGGSGESHTSAATSTHSPPSPLQPSEWKRAYMRQHEIEMNWRRRPLRHPKTLKGHDDHVITCLQFWGNRIVSGSDDNTLKVWSADTGKCLRTLVGHTGGVWSSQMKDNIIISGSTDRTLKVWDADTGDCIHTLYGHTSTVRCMHIHDSTVVSGSRDATLRIWDVDSGECLHVLMGHVAAVRCVQYDGKRVISGAYDYMVKVWNPEMEECLYTLQGHTNRVYSLQFDGKHIVSGSLDTSIRVWDVDTGNCIHTLIGHQSLTSGMELKNNILVSGNADSTVKVWDIISGQCLQTLSGSNKHQSAVTCLQFTSKFVVTSSDDGTVKLWDLKTGEFVRNLVTLESGGSGGVVWRVRSSATKLVCAVGSRNGTEETKLLVLDFDAAPPTSSLCASPESCAVVSEEAGDGGGDGGGDAAESFPDSSLSVDNENQIFLASL